MDIVKHQNGEFLHHELLQAAKVLLELLLNIINFLELLSNLGVVIWIPLNGGHIKIGDHVSHVVQQLVQDTLYGLSYLINLVLVHLNRTQKCEIWLAWIDMIINVIKGQGLWTHDFIKDIAELNLIIFLIKCFLRLVRKILLWHNDL